METKCSDTILVQYSGTSQAQRILQALSVQFALVDERTPANLILFAKKYSAYLNYYDLTNAIAGTWQNIMGKDVAITIAAVASWRIKEYTPFLENLSDEIKNAATDTDRRNHFKIFFDFVFTLAANLDEACKKLPADVSFKQFLSVSIASKLAYPLNTLIYYYNSFSTATPPLIDVTSGFTDPLTPVDSIILSEDFHLADLGKEWQFPGLTVPGITLSGNVHDDIDHIITHNLFTGAVQSFTDGIINIISRAPDFLQETLQNYPSHEPHYALYLTFLRLFRFSQNHLNTYTQRHLDFYYKDVLRLTNNNAEPDFVHLVFELQKNTSQHLLSKGTPFKAGKDANNKDLFYALTDNIVVQKASVQSLKSLFLGKDASPVTLYASPVANSEDGQGAKLLSVDHSWAAFGDPKKIKQANIGFAIASNVLYLNEGTGTVTLTFQCESTAGLLVTDLSGIFSIQFTGKKNWYTAAGYTASTAANSFSLTIKLGSDAPPIVPYSAKIHGGNFTQALPMVQVLLTNYTSYQKIKWLRIKNITVGVTATVKNLSLQNDAGKINAAKPFKPFGEFPEKGASFIIGSKEVFQKPLTQLVIDIDWQQVPVKTVTVNLAALKQEDWTPLSSKVNLFASTITIKNSFGVFIQASEFTLLQNVQLSSETEQLSVGATGISELSDLASMIYLSNTQPVTVSGLNTIPQAAADFTANEDYSITSPNGFIKLSLNESDYNLGTYINQLPKPSVKVNYDSGDTSKIVGYTSTTPAVKLPAPPAAKSIKLTYTAEQTIAFNEATRVNFDNRTNFYYHLEPFGYRELHPFVTTDTLSLLPIFNLDDGIAKHNGGELWIGLSNALPEETFSILFQVSDGSANPLKNMTTVNWFYLSNDNWLKFDHLSVTDQTNNFTRSGLVVLSVPAGATTVNQRADAGIIWIKAVVDHDSDAICKFIAVLANGAKAQFVQDLSRQIEFTKTLTANSISKPAVADASLKKTQQPYPSFGGRVRETDDQLSLRVSERLRHKQRAITAWDYERLTLQQFTQIHKVKCLNHTGFITDEKTNTQKYSETLAGHVMVVTIPDLTNINTANPLRPYTSIGLLTEIQQYLAKLTSPFVRLHVCNPQFEEIQFDFKVTFLPNYDINFYTNQLNAEIEQFLTPWAFGNATDIEFGNTIEKSVVLNFIEERPYVDFVTCFKMNHIISRNGATIHEALYNIEEATASTARSILVSYYNEELKQKHLITSPANCTCND
jgi:hypothetical protein